MAEQDLRQGRRLLQALLPTARAMARKSPSPMTGASQLGVAGLAVLTERHLDALLIYPAPEGGWHADVRMKNVPPGYPATFGTPSAHPLKTREEAEQQGIGILAGLLATMAQRKATPAPLPEPVFVFHNAVITLSSSLFTQLLEAIPALADANGYGSGEAAEDRIRVFEEAHGLQGMTPEQFKELPADTVAELMSVLHMAALSGCQRYPRKTNLSPSGHKAPSGGKPN